MLHHIASLILLSSPLTTASSPSTTSTTTCTSHHMMEAVKATSHCKPILKVVKLDMPGNGSFTEMTPRYVESLRCGGGCHATQHSCVPTMQVPRTIPILLSSCQVGKVVCDKTCATITIQEHSQCQCACLEEQRVCNNARHFFNNMECRCECMAEEEYTLCRDQGRFWDSEECVCRCPMEMIKPCSTGLQFSMSTCSCTTEDDDNISDNITDNRVERSGVAHKHEDTFGELAVIVALASVATVFFIIILSLLHSINTLKTSIRNIKESMRRSEREEFKYLVRNPQ